MKQLKITLKHVMLIVALTFSAISCQKEEVIQTEVIRIENQTSNYKIQNIGKDIISKNKILSEKLLAFSSKSTDKNSSMSLRDVYNEAYDFTIETDQAIYIENSQYHSYTFTIYRDEPNNLVENLVFSLQDDGSYKTILMKYSLTNEDINAILNNEETQISYDNKVDWETLDINLDGLLYKNYQIGNNLYYNSDSGYCYKEIGIISAATGWEDTQQQVVDCPNDLDTEHFSEDDGGGFTTTNNPDTDPTDTSDPNGGETGNTGNTSNPGNTGNNPPADITTPNISISEQILNCLNSNININNPVYYDNAFLRSLGLNLSDLRNYLITQNQCSPEAHEIIVEFLENVSAYPFPHCSSFEYSKPPGINTRACAVTNLTETFYAYGEQDAQLGTFVVTAHYSMVFFTMPTWMTNGQAATNTAIAVEKAFKMTKDWFYVNYDATEAEIQLYLDNSLIQQMGLFGGTKTEIPPFNIPSPAPYTTSLFGTGNCN